MITGLRLAVEPADHSPLLARPGFLVTRSRRAKARLALETNEVTHQLWPQELDGIDAERGCALTMLGAWRNIKEVSTTCSARKVRDGC